MNRKQKIKDQLLIIGDYYSLKNNNTSRIKTIKILDFQTSKNNKGKSINPSHLHKIYSQDQYIAIIDKNHQAWLIGQPFNFPVNISQLIHKKINKIFLGEKQMIVQCKNQYYLINWGSIKTLDNNLMKISTYNTSQYHQLFLAYLITSAQQGTIYYYTLDKKIQNLNRLYQINNLQYQIIGYPTFNKIKIQNKIIKGISVGKYHSLFWDQQGSLYSWGCRSLALGYGHFPNQDLVQIPQKVALNKHTIMAYAASHYSLALTSQGTIYQWGIKLQFNEINEQPIFKPRPLDFRFFNCTAKFISLKGRDNNFAALSSAGQLYVWGLNAKHLLSSDIILPPSWHGTYIYEPVLQTELIHHRIVDFTIQLGYIGVIIGGENQKDEPQTQYWQLLRSKAKLQLNYFKNNRTKTQNNQNLAPLRKKYKNNIMNTIITQRRHLSIENEDKAIKPVTCHRIKHESLVNLKPQVFKKTAPLLTNNCWPNLMNNFSIHKRQVSDFLQYNNILQNEKMNLRCTDVGQSSAQSHVSSSHQNKRIHHHRGQKKFSENYSIKLQGVLQKKKKLQILSLTTNLKKIDERQIQFKQKKKQQQQAKKQRQQQIQIIKQSIQQFLLKNYLIRLFIQPLSQARQIKIQGFKRIMMMSKVQKSIKNLFNDIKIKSSIQVIQKQKYQRFILLALYFKNYVIKFRSKKKYQIKNLIISTIIKKINKQKICKNILKLTYKINKINKLKDWIHLYNKQRIKILKQLWNNFILATLKISDGGQININNFSIDLTFKQKFQYAVENRQIGSLDDYYRGQIKKTKIKFLTKKSINDNKKRLGGKLIQQFKQKLSNIDILPYSLHYNTFKKPKNYDININQNMKNNIGWIEIQKNILKNIIQNIIKKHDIQYLQKYKLYQIQLAYYIKNNYQNFYQLRWKYIIQYNKMEKTLEKKRKQKYLKRLLNLIGMQKLFDDDCIPQKSIVLQQALLRKDVPKPPNPYIDFNIIRFQQTFKLYWENIYLKAKQIRKKFI